MEQLAVSELQQITVEIKVLKNQTAQNIIEIGKRLKRVKESKGRGEYLNWLESEVEFTRQTASRFIQVAEQFGNGTPAYHLGTKKLFELIALPESVDRQEFVEQPHTIPSTGESKTVDEMTVKELREVKRSLKEAEQRAERAEAERRRVEGQAKDVWDSNRKLREENERLKWAKSPDPKVVEKVVEVEKIPQKIQEKMDWDQIVINDAKRKIQELKDEIESFKLQQTDGFDPEQAKLKRQKLETESNISTLQLKVYITEFLKRVSVIAFMEGALASADRSVKRELTDSISSLESYLSKVKSALNSKIIYEEAQYQEV